MTAVRRPGEPGRLEPAPKVCPVARPVLPHSSLRPRPLRSSDRTAREARCEGNAGGARFPRDAMFQATPPRPRCGARCRRRGRVDRRQASPFRGLDRGGARCPLPIGPHSIPVRPVFGPTGARPRRPVVRVARPAAVPRLRLPSGPSVEDRSPRPRESQSPLRYRPRRSSRRSEAWWPGAGIWPRPQSW